MDSVGNGLRGVPGGGTGRSPFPTAGSSKLIREAVRGVEADQARRLLTTGGTPMLW